MSFDASAAELTADKAALKGFPILLFMEMLLISIFIPIVILQVYILVKYYDVDRPLAKKLAWKFQIAHVFLLIPLIWFIAYLIQGGLGAFEAIELTSISDKLFALTAQSAWHVYERSWLFPTTGYFLFFISFILSGYLRKRILGNALTEFGVHKISEITRLSHVTDYILIFAGWGFWAGILISL